MKKFGVLLAVIYRGLNKKGITQLLKPNENERKRLQIFFVVYLFHGLSQALFILVFVWSRYN